MPILVKFMLKHAVFGYGVAFVFTAILLWLDIGGLATLMWQSDFRWLAAGMLFFFMGTTFSSLQLGIAIMSLRPEKKSDDDDQGNLALPADQGEVALAFKPARRK